MSQTHNPPPSDDVLARWLADEQRVGAILEALEKIYEVPRVVDELLGR